MKLAIMQPYFLPYIGYFQLAASVDTFVIYDDVHYIKKGWVNRNRILVNGAEHFFNVEILGASQNLSINALSVQFDAARKLKTIEHAYRKAPQFGRVFPLMQEILSNPETNLAAFLATQLKAIAGFLGIACHWVMSSDLAKDVALRGEEKILAICRLLGASEYHNPIGGTALYDREHFRQQGVNLRFLQPRPISYRQFGETFVPGLSILDVLMFNDAGACRHLLGEYDLV